MKTREIESIQAQEYYIILYLKLKNNHINLHSISENTHSPTCTSAWPKAKPFILEALFTRYTLSPYWTMRKFTTLAVNISKFNNLVAEVTKKKKSPKNPSASRLEVLEMHPNQCPMWVGKPRDVVYGPHHPRGLGMTWRNLESLKPLIYQKLL